MEYKTWSKKGEKWAPFHPRTGSLLSYPEYSYCLNPETGKYDSIPYEWKEVSMPFEARLHYKTWHRGRSAVTFYWEEVGTKVEYPMFAHGMNELLHNIQKLQLCLEMTDEGLTIFGAWRITKKGQNYGIEIIL